MSLFPVLKLDAALILELLLGLELGELLSWGCELSVLFSCMFGLTACGVWFTKLLLIKSLILEIDA